MIARALGVASLLALGCSSPAEPAPERTASAVEAPHADPVVEVPEPIVMAPGSLGLPPETGETALIVCTLDALLLGAETHAAIGALAWRSDGVLFVAADQALRAFDIEDSRDCRLRTHTAFGERGTLSLPELAAGQAQLTSDDAGHVYFADGSSVLRIERRGETEYVTPPLALAVDQITARPSGEFAIARVGHALVRIAGDDALASTPEPLGLRARDVSDVHFVDAETLLFRRRGEPAFVDLNGAPRDGRTLVATEESGPFALELVRGMPSGLVVGLRGPGARLLVFGSDGAFLRAVNVGSSVDFALEFANPAEGPASVTGLSAVRERVAYAAFEVMRAGFHEGGVVRISGL